ncbi:MAG: 50S ribosomal protein L25 [Aureispira sp.]|nr:50S ribosomal protein L25 [Aureispira sp.]
MKTIEIAGKGRAATGKKSTQELRKENNVPCVIYGGENNIHFSAHKNAFRDLIYTDEFKKATITVEGGATVDAIVKDVQFHPVTDSILHIDFLQLVPGQKLKTELPIKLTGSPEGVKAGGTLVQKIRKLKVLTTPESLASAIEVDVSHLAMGKSIRIRDVKVDENTQVMNSLGIPLASIEIPRAMRSAQSKEEDTAEDGDAAEA